MARQTGDFEIAGTVEITFTVPDIPWVKRAFLGEILKLADENGWVEFGTATVDQAAAVFVAIYTSWEQS